MCSLYDEISGFTVVIKKVNFSYLNDLLVLSFPGFKCCLDDHYCPYYLCASKPV